MLERSICVPVLLISLNRRKLKFEVPLIPRFAYVPNIVDLNVRRLFAFWPRAVNRPEILKVVNEFSLQ